MLEKLVGIGEIEITFDEKTNAILIIQENEYEENDVLFIPLEYIDLFIAKLVRAKNSIKGSQ